MASNAVTNIDDREIPMREARVVVGGKLGSFAGVLPGIAEEVLYSLEAGQPLYLVGGFGGAAAAICDAIRTGSCPQELTLDAMRSDAKVRATHEVYERQEIRPGPKELHDRLLAALRKPLPDNGLSPAENERLRTTTVLAEMVSLIRQGLSRRFGPG
jgi:hypothetical protein